MQHHKFSPSSLERRKACPASARLEDGLPDVPNPYSEEGTLLHKVIQQIVVTGNRDSNITGLTADQIELVDFAIGTVKAIIEGCGKSGIYTEIKVNDGNRHGYVDLLIVPDSAGIPIQAIDYKFGAGPVKPVTQNLQMRDYANMTRHYLSLGDRQIVAHIIQPKRNWHDAALIDDFNGITKEITEIIKNGSDPNAPIIPGDHCRFCKALAHGVCTGVELSLAAIESFMPTAPDISTCTDVARISDWYEKWIVVKKIGKAVEDRLRSIIKETGQCGKYTSKASKGNRAIADIMKTWERIGGTVGIDRFLGACSCSVTQLEKAYIEALYKKGENTKDRLKDDFAGIMGDLIVDGTPKVSIVEKKD